MNQVELGFEQIVVTHIQNQARMSQRITEESVVDAIAKMAIAMAAIEMAMAGIEFAIPADEVIDTMGEIGASMDVRYRETAGGGLAATPTGRRLAKERLYDIKRAGA